GLRLAHDRELHDERVAVVGEQLREQPQEMVEQVPAPVVERAVARRLLVRVDRHLVEARDYHGELPLGLPLVEVDLLAGDAVGDSVPESVRERVRDRIAVDVDRVDAAGAVQRELDAEDPAAAADVEAISAGADAGREEVLPAQVAP